jgi:hypothetical protein
MRCLSSRIYDLIVSAYLYHEYVGFVLTFTLCYVYDLIFCQSFARICITRTSRILFINVNVSTLCYVCLRECYSST